jgi:hypothetical protein
MMTVEEWRKRAHACMAASRLTSDSSARMQWQSLSEGWFTLIETRSTSAEQHDRGESSADKPVAVAGGERLRTRLSLVR